MASPYRSHGSDHQQSEPADGSFTASGQTGYSGGPMGPSRVVHLSTMLGAAAAIFACISFTVP